MTDNGIKQIVAELDDMRYSGADIARVLRISRERVRQILADVNPKPEPLRTIEDLPQHMRQRVQDYIDNRPNLDVVKATSAQTG